MINLTRSSGILYGKSTRNKKTKKGSQWPHLLKVDWSWIKCVISFIYLIHLSLRVFPLSFWIRNRETVTGAWGNIKESYYSFPKVWVTKTHHLLPMLSLWFSHFIIQPRKSRRMESILRTRHGGIIYYTIVYSYVNILSMTFRNRNLKRMVLTPLSKKPQLSIEHQSSPIIIIQIY